MVDLFAAIDETNDGEFLSFIVCDNSSLIRNISILPNGFTHMTEVYPRHLRRSIINNLDLNGVTLAFCVKFDIPKVRDILSNTKLSRLPHSRIQRKVSYRMVSAVNKMYSKFLLKRGLHGKKYLSRIKTSTVIISI